MEMWGGLGSGGRGEVTRNGMVIVMREEMGWGLVW